MYAPDVPFGILAARTHGETRPSDYCLITGCFVRLALTRHPTRLDELRNIIVHDHGVGVGIGVESACRTARWRAPSPGVS